MKQRNFRLSIAKTFMRIFDPDTGAPVIFLNNERIDETEVTGKVGSDWRPNDDMLAFFNLSTGYKSDGSTRH